MLQLYQWIRDKDVRQPSHKYLPCQTHDQFTFTGNWNSQPGGLTIIPPYCTNQKGLGVQSYHREGDGENQKYDRVSDVDRPRGIEADVGLDTWRRIIGKNSWSSICGIIHNRRCRRSRRWSLNRAHYYIFLALRCKRNAANELWSEFCYILRKYSNQGKRKIRNSQKRIEKEFTQKKAMSNLQGKASNYKKPKREKVNAVCAPMWIAGVSRF